MNNPFFSAVNSGGGAGTITEQIIQVLTQLRDTPIPPPAEDPAGPMPRGSTVMAAVLGFRRTTPDPLAVDLFEDWVRPVFTTGNDGFPRLNANVAPIGYEELRRIAFLGGAPAGISILRGDDQSAPKGTKVPITPAVLVVDAANRPVRSAVVTFRVTAGGGKFADNQLVEVRLTDSNGTTAVSEWTLGSSAGNNEMTAELGIGSSEIRTTSLFTEVTFSATAT
jgi:hypothetical protein